MKKLDYKLKRKEVLVNESTWNKFAKYLKDNKLTFSQWVREQIKKVIK